MYETGGQGGQKTQPPPLKTINPRNLFANVNRVHQKGLPIAALFLCTTDGNIEQPASWTETPKSSGKLASDFYGRDAVKLLNTYDDHDDAKDAAEKLVGEKRLASERDATVVIYNLFGIPSWGNFHRLGMYNLIELKGLLDRKTYWQPEDINRHQQILATLNTVAKNYSLELPSHWL